MSILLKQVKTGTKVFEILLSTKSDSYRRLVGAIPPTTMEAHAKRVVEELQQLPESTVKVGIGFVLEAGYLKSLWLTLMNLRCMYHDSKQNRIEHMSVYCFDASGKHLKTIHIAKNKSEQQNYR
jgi:hypothetical protein